MNTKEFFMALGARPDVATAVHPGHALVDASVAAGVNVLPGARSIGPNEVPEVVALPVADGHHPSLAWVASATRTPGT